MIDKNTRMGRPLKGGKPKDKRTEILMDEDEHKMMRTMASANGESNAEYVRRLIREDFMRKPRQ
ncbi:hypothetical protein ABUK63_10615 [Lactococcus lactis]|uniref:hypothetical protein n=1 Tax=Lactococcus lactis TaxID=1358 RepID=UPI003D2D0AE6